jgi:hypothetical protein
MTVGLKNRLKKAENQMIASYSYRDYVEALKRYFAGQDDGESYGSLPPLESINAQFTMTDVHVAAITELEMQARLAGNVFKMREDFQQEVDRRLKEAGCLIS